MITIRPKPKLFPSHHNLVLDVREQAALDMLFDLDPLLDDERELLHQVLRAGIKTMNQHAEKHRDPHEPTRTQVETAKRASSQDVGRKRSVHFPRHVEIDLTNDQRDRLDYLADRVPHESDAALLSEVLSLGICAMREVVDRASATETDGSTLEAPSPKRPRSVENYLGYPIEEDLRRRLEEFLNDCPGVLTDEEAFQMLIDLGLRHAEGRAPAEVLKKVRAATRRRQRILAGLRPVR